MPEAVIKLKQGFGRLIRSKADRGIVVILDPRVLSKPYGRTFLNSLPDCPRVVENLDPPGTSKSGFGSSGFLIERMASGCLLCLWWNCHHPSQHLLFPASVRSRWVE